ncbi:MAG: ribosome-associated translation inhibitor RaiA [Sphingomonadaceae bacterium]|nr:ribosome-associated translation inhibitor RaiA [Sphingomonadaceae bacterium]
MDIRVSGHQIDTGDALKAHVEERLNAISEKYFARTLSAHVTFGKGPYEHSFRCDIVAHVMQGLVLRGEGGASDAHAAFDQASGRVEKQLRRYMSRLKDRHHQGNGEDLAPPDAAGYTVFQGADEEDEPSDNPPIVAETRVDIPDASVSDAVMMLDLRNTNALLFKNSGTGAFNMVYRRNDGTIGWVEPGRAA